MSLTRKQKDAVVTTMTDTLSQRQTFIFTHFEKISVVKLRELRKELYALSASLQMIKKSLLRIALKNAGLSVDPVMIKGAQCAVGVVCGGADQIQLARTVSLFAALKENTTFRVFGALFDGQCVGVDTVKELAKWPSREALYAQFLRQLKNPLSQLVYTLQAIANKNT